MTTTAAWAPDADDLAALETEHRARVGALDPLVAIPDLGAVPDDQGLLAVRLPDGSRAAGLVTVGDVGPDSSAALFRPLREHRLRARAAGPDVPGAVAALLAAWSERVANDPGTPPDGDGVPQVGPAPRDHGRVLLWPSRDVGAVAALAAHGMRPTVHLAARRGTAPGAAGHGPAGLVVRDATPDDVPALVAHQLAELAYDELVGAARVRPGAREHLATQVAGAVANPATTFLVATAPPTEVGGTGDRAEEVLGVVAVEPPERSGAVAGTVTTGPVAYLVLLHVTGAARGARVGGTLVDAALARVRERAGEDAVVLLHHGVLNPLSAPFWARQGFRPVLTTWELPVSGTVGPTT
ncbi:ribosomal protein S18 acetylase RimI-like enzyme [Cellulosimicrobium cellulans]|uniref:GNAT family N-acetyltransferase n=1 Tax=Cellulosimicrobium cellulans TaxID=1710 RepID=UPI00195CD5DC|nr:GNAT family N-acetyltransferase [Cellulosimicrobium cellulans]MBM7819001.1 ribosomal protein S18 acetylase RimI-like enzyme [Cellulosimicrobium cellulans]